MRDTRRTKRSEEPEEYVVNFEIKGHGRLTVEAHSIEEAEDKAWGAYHAGEELQDVEWEVDDLTVSKSKSGGRMRRKVEGLDLTENDRRVLADVLSVCERVDGYMPHGSADHVAIRRLEEAGLVVCEGVAECEDEDCEAHEGGYYVLTDAGKAQL